MHYRKVCIIVPAFNEELSIKRVVESIRKVNRSFQIVVINDGSTDNTKKIVEKLGVTLINLPFNLGIGAAVQTGLIFAKNNNFDVAIQVDADGQHNPKDIPRLVKNLKGVDLIIGSRYLKKTKYETPLIRLTGIKIFSQLIYWICDKRIYDSTSGYRAFNNKAVNYFSNYYPQEFPEPRSIVSFLKSGYKIKEIPVEMSERIGGKSSVNFMYAIYLMLSISIAIVFESAKTKGINKI